MKYVVVLAVAACVGYGGWKVLGKKSSEAYLAYEKFTDALFEARHHDAEQMAIGESALAEINADKRAYAMLGGQSVVHFANRKLESETVSEDGKTVTLKVTVDCRRGGGLPPAGPPTVRYKHTAVMVLTDEGWKVDTFESEATSLVQADPEGGE